MISCHPTVTQVILFPALLTKYDSKNDSYCLLLWNISHKKTLQKLWQVTPGWLASFRQMHLELSTNGNMFQGECSRWTQSP